MISGRVLTLSVNWDDVDAVEINGRRIDKKELAPRECWIRWADVLASKAYLYGPPCGAEKAAELGYVHMLEVVPGRLHHVDAALNRPRRRWRVVQYDYGRAIRMAMPEDRPEDCSFVEECFP